MVDSPREKAFTVVEYPSGQYAYTVECEIVSTKDTFQSAVTGKKLPCTYLVRVGSDTEPMEVSARYLYQSDTKPIPTMQPTSIGSHMVVPLEGTTQKAVCQVRDYFFVDGDTVHFVVQPLLAYDLRDKTSESITKEFEPSGTLQHAQVYEDAYRGTLDKDAFVALNYDHIYFMHGLDQMTPSLFQSLVRRTLKRVITEAAPGQKGWIRTRVRKYIQRQHKYGYGFTANDKFVIRSNQRLTITTTLNEHFLKWHNIGDLGREESDWNEAHEHCIIFGYVQKPLSDAERREGEKDILRFFTAKSVDGFDALYTFLATDGKHGLFKGKTLGQIIGMSKARDTEYDHENDWWRFTEDRPNDTVWSQLMSAYFSISSSLGLPAVRHFLHMYLPVEYAAYMKINTKKA